MKPIFLGLFILIVAASSGSSQNASGTIEGMVRDLSGAPVTEATVYGSASNDMRRRITTTSDSSGRFVFRDVQPGNYEIHAYKESAGYADTFFSFFANGNKKAWRMAKVEAGRTSEGIVLQLGPKYATLRLSIRDRLGNPVGGSVTFARVDDPKRPYGVGINPSTEILVPPVPFRFEIVAQGYQTWHSKLISLRSGQTISVTARLSPAGNH